MKNLKALFSLSKNKLVYLFIFSFLNMTWTYEQFSWDSALSSFLSLFFLFQTSVSVMFSRLRSASLRFSWAEISFCSSPASLPSPLPSSISPSSGSVFSRITPGSACVCLKLRLWMTPAGGDAISGSLCSSSSSSSSRWVLEFLSCSMDWDRAYRKTQERETEEFIMLIQLHYSQSIMGWVVHSIKYTFKSLDAQFCIIFPDFLTV